MRNAYVHTRTHAHNAHYINVYIFLTTECETNLTSRKKIFQYLPTIQSSIRVNANLYRMQVAS